MHSIEIRDIIEVQLPQAFAVLRELRPQLDYPTFCSRLARQSKNGYALHGAFEGQKLVGLIGLRPVETMARGKHLHVDDLIIVEQKRGQGLGRQLLVFAEQFALKNELGSVFVDSRREAISFYESMRYEAHSATLMRKRFQ